MINVKEILERAKEFNSIIPVGWNDDIHGYDSALLGIDAAGRLVYSKEKMVEYWMKVSGMDSSESWQFLEYNTFNAYMGVMTPIYINQFN
jgi:hypothetical protein